MHNPIFIYKIKREIFEIMDIKDIKASLDVCDKMIDILYRQLFSNESLMGATSDMFARMTDEEKEEYAKTRKQHANLIAYRKALLNEAANSLKTATPSLVVEDDFSF